MSRKLRELTEEDIDKIADTYKAFVDGTLEEIKGFCGWNIRRDKRLLCSS